MTTDDISHLTDRGATLNSLLGSFLAGLYGGRDAVEALARARDDVELQTREDVLTLAACTGLDGTPLYRAIRWRPVTLRLTEKLTPTSLTLDGSDGFGDGEADAILSAIPYDYPVPDGLASVPLLVNSPASPDVVLVNGIDYTLDEDLEALRFTADPLYDTRLTVTLSYNSSGSLTERTLILWAAEAGDEERYLATQHGYVLGIEQPSSESYRLLLQALQDAGIQGPTRADLEQALSALTGGPLAREDGEVVEVVRTEPERQLIITDRRVYEAGVDATILVVPGQELRAGDRLSDAFEVIDLAGGAPPAANLASLTLPVSFFQISLSGGLTFENANLATTITTVGGRTRLEFPITGEAGDVTAFWDAVHAAGEAEGAQTLAQLLDSRPPPQTNDPDAESLPAYLNPLDFMASNLLGYSLLVVRLTPASYGPGALGTSVLTKVLRTVVPPQQAVVVLTS